MKKGLLAALIGVCAGAAVFGAYFAAPRFGVRIPPDLLLVAAAALAFAGTVAVFALVAMDRPGFLPSRARLLLNEEPATEYVFPFAGPNLVQVVVRPGMSLGEIFARFDSVFKKAPDEVGKDIVLTIRGSRKMSLATYTLQQVFLTLKPYSLLHVLLKDEKDAFIGYIAGKRAIKEFTGGDTPGAADESANKITKYIVWVIDHPDEAGVLREIGGATSEDTVKDTDDTFDAERTFWGNEAVQGLVVLHHLRPAGYISKVDVLRLSVGRL